MASRQQNIQTVTDAAYALGVPVEIALAQANHESGFRDRALGKDGERGLMQPLPSTWRNVMGGASFDQAFDPETNLYFWQLYFGSLLNKYGWDYSKALMAYNGGPGNVDRGTISQAARNYAASILAAAGWSGGGSSTPSQPSAIPTNEADASQPSTTPDGSGLLLPIAIGAVLLLLLFSD